MTWRPIQFQRLGWATAAMWFLTLATAALVAAVPGASAACRAALALRVSGCGARNWTEAAGYFATNVRVLAARLALAWLRPRCGRARHLVDVVAFGVPAANAAIVGAAIGAYGATLAARLPHLPLEWLALSIALVSYRADSGRTVAPRLRATAAAVALLAAAAVVEAFVA